MKTIFLLSMLFVNAAFTTNNADAIVGVWKNGSGKGHIQIFKQEGKYFGKIIWLKDNRDVEGKPKVDRKNTDPQKRNRPIIGMIMMRDFKYSGGEWNNGRIYNPSDGKEYKAYMKLNENNSLSVRGYMGISLLGKNRYLDAGKIMHNIPFLK